MYLGAVTDSASCASIAQSFVISMIMVVLVITARTSVLNMLDHINHQGLRLAAGAFRTSPVLSLYAEMNLPPLNYREFSLGCMDCVRVRSVACAPLEIVLRMSSSSSHFETNLS